MPCGSCSGRPARSGTALGVYDSAAWRGTYAIDSGSLIDQGVHYVDLLRWCMGPPVEVTSVCSTQAHQIEAEDTALAIVRFASGAVAAILSSAAAFAGFPQRLEIAGTKGTVTVEDGRIVGRALAGGLAVHGPLPRTPVESAAAGTRPRWTCQLTPRSSPTCSTRSTPGASPRVPARAAATRSRSSSPCTSRPAPAAR